jgi:hypothetical protein
MAFQLTRSTGIPVVSRALPTSISSPTQAPQQKTAPAPMVSVEMPTVSLPVLSQQVSLPAMPQVSLPVLSPAPVVSTVPMTSDAVATLVAPTPAAPVGVPAAPPPRVPFEAPQVEIQLPVLPAAPTIEGDFMLPGNYTPDPRVENPNTGSTIPVFQNPFSTIPQMPSSKEVPLWEQNRCADGSRPIDTCSGEGLCLCPEERDQSGMQALPFQLGPVPTPAQTSSGMTRPALSFNTPAQAPAVMPSMANIRMLGPVAVPTSVSPVQELPYCPVGAPYSPFNMCIPQPVPVPAQPQQRGPVCPPGLIMTMTRQGSRCLPVPVPAQPQQRGPVCPPGLIMTMTRQGSRCLPRGEEYVTATACPSGMIRIANGPCVSDSGGQPPPVTSDKVTKIKAGDTSLPKDPARVTSSSDAVTELTAMPGWDAYSRSAQLPPPASKCQNPNEFFGTAVEGPFKGHDVCCNASGVCYSPSGWTPCKKTTEFYGRAEVGPFKGTNVCCDAAGACYDPAIASGDGKSLVGDDKTKTYLLYGAGALAILGIAYLAMKKGK